MNLLRYILLANSLVFFTMIYTRTTRNRTIGIITVIVLAVIKIIVASVAVAEATVVIIIISLCYNKFMLHCIANNYICYK